MEILKTTLISIYEDICSGTNYYLSQLQILVNTLLHMHAQIACGMNYLVPTTTSTMYLLPEMFW